MRFIPADKINKIIASANEHRSYLDYDNPSGEMPSYENTKENLRCAVKEYLSVLEKNAKIIEQP